MSSLEISDLTEKRHDNVMVDIRAMLEGLNLPALSFQGSYKDKNKQDRPCFNLPLDFTETLINGYSIPLRHAVVVRLRQLEEQVANNPCCEPERSSRSALPAAWL
ncbi:Rha family transcriptional regulator [Pseudomonas sp. 18058]|uniref:Rha family transcriptional regulator n=1 Tax=Pseudomonas sp. 18058 TaxID=2681406 RepID=UPI001356CDEE|nr:Rha family transcriptional regulator [Pseudomonas sp. 18058]